jgi:hypothetical protein
VEEIDELRNQRAVILQIDGIGFVPSHQSKTFKTGFSGQLIIQSISENCDDRIDVILLENVVRDCEELSHRENTILLHFLINILLLKFFHNGFVQVLDHASVRLRENSFRSLKLDGESA